MIIKNKKLIVFLGILLITIIFFLIKISCTKQESTEVIIASVGTKTISLQEFISRAEFTVHPRIFNSKSAVLNNLVSEKLIAIDAGDHNRLLLNERFQAYIRGIQEQSMLEQLYLKEAFSQVVVDTYEIKETYKLAGREYNLAFYFTKPDMANKINQSIRLGKKTAGEIFEELKEIVLPINHKVKWRDPEHEVIHKALFSKPLSQDTILGPLTIGEEGSIILKILDWKDYPTVSGEDALLRSKEVVKKLKETKANAKWGDYIKQLMQGKEIRFKRESFRKLAQYFFDLRSALNDEQKKIIVEDFWDTQQDIPDLNGIDRKELFLASSFFQVNGDMWSVNDFMSALASHPLVYRKHQISSKEFKDQFRLAIMDLIRDHYATREAYRMSLDKNRVVQRNVSMWKDALIASYYSKEVIKSLMKKENISEEDMKKKDQYFQLYIDRLYDRYKDEIKINTIELEKIKLTDVNMYVIRPNVPFPVVVPNFPQFTTMDRLNIE